MNRLFNYFHKQDTLSKNSFLLIVSNGVLSSSGFLFWILVARLYSTTNIGIATTIFSLMTLLTNISLLGFNTGLIHFLPNSSTAKEKINSSVSIVLLVSFLVSLLTISFIHLISPNLAFLKSNPLYLIIFMIFTITASVNNLTDSIFIAFKEAKYILFKSIILCSTRLLLPFTLLSLGAMGIFTSLSLGFIISVIYSFFIIFQHHEVLLRPRISQREIKTMAYFSLGTFTAGIVATLPTYILPIIITNLLSPTYTAYYYIASTMAFFIFMIPAVVTQNLLAEGSYNPQELRQYVYKTTKLIFVFIIPLILFLCFFGQYVLLIFGKKYSLEGLDLLRLLAVSGIFVAFGNIFATILIVLGHIKIVVSVSILNSASLIILTILLIHLHLIGIGLAMLITQALFAFISFVILRLLYPKWNNLKIR